MDGGCDGSIEYDGAILSIVGAEDGTRLRLGLRLGTNVRDGCGVLVGIKDGSIERVGWSDTVGV